MDGRTDVRVTVEPPMETWPAAYAVGRDGRSLRAAAGRWADELGLARPEGEAPIIATGHQAWLWHPGILAKDMAAAEAARAVGTDALHVVVDQDVHETLVLEVPHRAGPRLEVRRHRLAATRPDLPTGSQPPADAAEVIRRLQDLAGQAPESAAAMRRLEQAVAAASAAPAGNLAQQVGLILHHLMRPWTGELPLFFATDLMRMPESFEVVRDMLHDAYACIGGYNQAVAATPGAGIAPLLHGPDLVELPLWLLRWQQPRRRVLADLGDRLPALVDETGLPIDLNAMASDTSHSPQADRLAPRALLLTALVRSLGCGLFIHGKGGGIYDRITEQWWSRWRGNGPALGPMAVVSADLFLDFDVPLADRRELAHAQWWAHHLPHNLDRTSGGLELDASLVQEKRHLLARMGDDRDRGRRRAAFNRLHALNEQMARERPDMLEAASRRLRDARIGTANAKVAARRDWCFALYPDEKLDALRRELGAGAAVLRERMGETRRENTGGIRGRVHQPSGDGSGG
jgi:hypothetical protein